MAFTITEETLTYVAGLSKLHLTEEEKEAAKKDMTAMIDYFDEMNELDTTDVEPMTNVIPAGDVFREDIICNEDGHEDLLANAPEIKEGMLKVPKTVE